MSNVCILCLNDVWAAQLLKTEEWFSGEYHIVCRQCVDSFGQEEKQCAESWHEEEQRGGGYGDEDDLVVPSHMSKRTRVQ